MKILYICGSLNQTTMMHQIADNLPEFESYFTPYYTDGFLGLIVKTGILDFTIMGGQAKNRTLDYLKEHQLNIDLNGRKHDYDLVFTCSDLIVPLNIRKYKVILVQEGMTDPENFAYYLVKYLGFPRWSASTSTTGLSDLYDIFCVASEGYKNFFISKGVRDEKIRVTGIPNFDNCQQYMDNDIPYNNYVLVATSDMRETYKYENRKKFIKNAVKIADGKQVIFKLHPNENIERATEEINKHAPGSIIYTDTNIDPLIANCDTLITRYSSVVYVGLALGKNVYSDFDLAQLKKMVPDQNGGTSAKNIALVAKEFIEDTSNNRIYAIRKELTLYERFLMWIKSRKRFAKAKN